MKLIVGLGNPGDKYTYTRHNLGFTIVDQFLKDIESVDKTTWDDNKKLKSDIFVLDYKSKAGKEQKVILAKPKTYMNGSGLAVSLITSFYKIKPEDVWVVHDELDLPLGSMRIRFGGGTAGHHGLDSILASLGTDKFWRFRIGIGSIHGKGDLTKPDIKHAESIVLEKFSPDESGSLKHAIKKGSEALELAIEKDLQSAMNRYNTK